MANRRIIKASDLSGFSIFQDPKRGTIFYDIISRKGYILTSSDVRTYTLYTAMLPLSIVIAVLAMSMFNLTYVTTFFIFLGLYLIAFLAYRFAFFYKLPEATNWKKVKKESVFLYLARGYSKARLGILIFLLAALTILMPIYAVLEQRTGIDLYGSYALAGASFIGMIIVILSLIIKIRNNY